MKRFFALYCVVSLAACGMFATGTDEANVWKSKRNTECAEFDSVKVFQTLEDSALARVCESGDTRYCHGMVVVVPKKWNLQLWDEKTVTPPEGKCFVYTDTVAYETRGNEKKTVPVLGFDYKYSPNSEEEAIERLQQGASDFYRNCYLNFETEKDKALKKEGQKLCECFESIDSVFQEDATGTDQQETLSPFDRYLSLQIKYLGNLETCTKKYPKAADAY